MQSPYWVAAEWKKEVFLEFFGGHLSENSDVEWKVIFGTLCIFSHNFLGFSTLLLPYAI